MATVNRAPVATRFRNFAYNISMNRMRHTKKFGSWWMMEGESGPQPNKAAAFTPKH
jgi:hypothetical protein